MILDIFTMYDEGATIKEIRDHLNGKSIKPKNGKEFTYTMLDRILHNRKYIGEYSFKDVVIPDGIPAIVPKDLFDRVQERLAKNKKAPARKNSPQSYFVVSASHLWLVKAVEAKRRTGNTAIINAQA